MTCLVHVVINALGGTNRNRPELNLYHAGVR
jgi:hypothetical protein